MSIIRMMSSDLSMGQNEILSIANNAESRHYQKFISGGRRIDAPDQLLKLLQFWVADFVCAETPELPDYVTAYELGRSIKNNASMHAQNAHVINLDIHHFFQSCTKDMVEKLFVSIKGYDLTSEDLKLLVSISTYKGHLTIGSPCSPFIANRIALSIDQDIRSKLPNDMRYSRYSDDISISSNNRINHELIVDVVANTLFSHGFEINRKKTHCFGKGGRRHVTGIFINPDGTLSLGHRRKKQLESMLYKYLIKLQGNPNEILGFINFCNYVEPDFTRKTLLKYGKYGFACNYSSVVDFLRQEKVKLLKSN